ncbi:transcriptional repressor [Actinomadura sp. 3N407]|uniref:transcriptional repressor n=1 Tax=Actinomadura sp. 3N407 TaxID=3457423 RepID=UPI003FCC63D8
MVGRRSSPPSKPSAPKAGRTGATDGRIRPLADGALCGLPGRRLLALDARTAGGPCTAQVLAEVPEFRSAQDIHGELRRRGERTGLATVYRHLQALRQDGTIDAIQDQSGETVDGLAVGALCANAADRACGAARSAGVPPH